MSDEELAFYYSQERNVYRAAALACLAVSDAQTHVDKSVGDLSISKTGIFTNYRTLAAEYRRRADNDARIYAGGISLTDKQTDDLNTDRVNPSFTRKLQGNPQLDNTQWRST